MYVTVSVALFFLDGGIDSSRILLRLTRTQMFLTMLQYMFVHEKEFLN